MLQLAVQFSRLLYAMHVIRTKQKKRWESEMVAPSGAEIFAKEWLIDVQEGNPSAVEVGNRFSRKILTQWLGTGGDIDDLYYCDSSGDMRMHYG